MLTNAESLAPLASTNQRNLWLAGFSHFILELCHSFMPVLYPLLVISMGLSYTQIGVLTLATQLTASLLQPFLSPLSDRFGAGRVATLSVLWLGLLMSVVSLAPNYPTLIVLLILASLGSSAFHPAGAELAARASRGLGKSSRRGLSMSIFSVGGSLGAALSPLLIALTVGAVGVHSAFTLLPIVVLSALFLYTQFGQSAGRRATQASTAGQNHRQRYLLGLVLVVVSAMTRAWFQVSLTTYLPTWVEHSGGTLAQGSWLLSLFLFALGVGSLLGGPLADRFSAWHVVFVSTLLLAPLYWLFLYSAGSVQLSALVIIGIALGATYPTAIMMAQDAWSHRMAFAAAVVMGWGWVPGGLGASFTGYIADQSSLDAGLRLLITPPLLGAFCILGYRLAQRK